MPTLNAPTPAPPPEPVHTCEQDFQRRSQWFSLALIVMGALGVWVGDHYNYRELIAFCSMVGGGGVQMMTSHIVNSQKGGQGNTNIMVPPGPPIDPIPAN